MDPLIAALIGKLPPPETMWPAAERALWINAMAHAFALVYRIEDECPSASPGITATVAEKPQP
jgi:hypothetical protein